MNYGPETTFDLFILDLLAKGSVLTSEGVTKLGELALPAEGFHTLINGLPDDWAAAPGDDVTFVIVWPETRAAVHTTYEGGFYTIKRFIRTARK